MLSLKEAKKRKKEAEGDFNDKEEIPSNFGTTVEMINSTEAIDKDEVIMISEEIVKDNENLPDSQDSTMSANSVAKTQTKLPELGYYGNKKALQAIRQILDSEPQENNRIFLCTGVPGIGKTCFFEQAAINRCFFIPVYPQAYSLGKALYNGVMSVKNKNIIEQENMRTDIDSWLNKAFEDLNINNVKKILVHFNNFNEYPDSIIGQFPELFDCKQYQIFVSFSCRSIGIAKKFISKIDLPLSIPYSSYEDNSSKISAKESKTKEKLVRFFLSKWNINQFEYVAKLMWEKDVWGHVESNKEELEISSRRKGNKKTKSDSEKNSRLQNVLKKEMEDKQNNFLAIYNLAFTILNGNPKLCTDFLIYFPIMEIKNPKELKKDMWDYFKSRSSYYSSPFTDFCESLPKNEDIRNKLLLDIVYLNCFQSEIINSDLDIRNRFQTKQIITDGLMHCESNGTSITLSLSILELIKFAPALPFDFSFLAAPNPDTNESFDITMLFLKEYWKFCKIENDKIVMTFQGEDYTFFTRKENKQKEKPFKFSVNLSNQKLSPRSVMKTKNTGLWCNGHSAPFPDSWLLFKNEQKCVAHFLQSKRKASSDGWFDVNDEVVKSFLETFYVKTTTLSATDFSADPLKHKSTKFTGSSKRKYFAFTTFDDWMNVIIGTGHPLTDISKMFAEATDVTNQAKDDLVGVYTKRDVNFDKVQLRFYIYSDSQKPATAEEKSFGVSIIKLFQEAEEQYFFNRDSHNDIYGAHFAAFRRLVSDWIITKDETKGSQNKKQKTIEKIEGDTKFVTKQRKKKGRAFPYRFHAIRFMAAFLCCITCLFIILLVFVTKN